MTIEHTAPPSHTADHRAVGTVSIVLEWENAADCPDETTLNNVRGLADRIVEASSFIDGRPILVIASDPHASSRAAFEAVVSESRSSHSGRLDVVALDTPNARYVDQKAAGLAATDSDIIVFADSDCVYHENWLVNLLAPLADPASDFSFGRNFMMIDDLWGQAALVYWFYPVAHEPPPPKSGVYFNNFAIRRRAYSRHPFPVRPGSRLACAIWCRGLPASGLKGVAVPAATADHPPPCGLRGVYARAIEYGRIDDGRYAARGFGRAPRFGRAMIRLIRVTSRSLRRGPSVAFKLRLGPVRILSMISVALMYAITTGLTQVRAALLETPEIPAVDGAHHSQPELCLANRQDNSEERHRSFAA
jgi:hypothetical protein